MIEESQGLNTFIDTNGPKSRSSFGKTLANYEELAETLENIDKQLVNIETRILGRPQPSDREHANKIPSGDRPEPGYIERLDDTAVRIRTSVNSLANIVGRLNDAI